MTRPRFVCLILALVTLLAFLPVRHNGFIAFDDASYITENRIVQAGLTWAGVKWAFTTRESSNWHPLTWLSHMLDCELFGMNAGAHHLVNVLFHAANAVLLLLLLYRMTGALWPSAFVAALFAWHPLHVESVAWAAERKDVLSTFFELLALLYYARAVTTGNWQLTGKKITRPEPVLSRVTMQSSHFLRLAFILFACALMAKPMPVTLPFVFLLLDYWPLGRFPNYEFRVSSFARLILEKWPFLVLAGASCAVTYLAQRDYAVQSLERYPLGLRVENISVSYGRYLLKAIWPVDLAIFYPLLKQLSWGDVGLATGILVIISWLVWRARRRWPYLLVGWLWYLGTLVPVIGLVQVGHQAMADRYTYVPLIGIFVIIAYGMADLAKRLRLDNVAVAVVGTMMLGGCLARTENQLRLWHDDETLFTHAIGSDKRQCNGSPALGRCASTTGSL